MMMTVHGYAVRPGEFAQDTSIQNANAMRSPIPRRSLLVLDRIRMLTPDVLNQRPAARDVQRLNSKTDGKDRYRSVLGFGERQQIGLVFFRMNAAEFWMRFASITQRIHIRIAPRQQKTVDGLHHSVNVIRPRNQRNVNG